MILLPLALRSGLALTPMLASTPVLDWAPMASACLICSIACLCAFRSLGRPAFVGGAGPLRHVTPGVLVGVAMWATPLAGLAFPAGAGLARAGVIDSLVLAVAASAWTFAAFRRCKGALRLIGPGAIMGAGAGASYGALLLSVRAPADLAFDDTLFCLGVAVSSGLSTAAFAVFARWRGPAGRLASATCLAAAVLAAQILALRSLTFLPHGWEALPANAEPVFPAGLTAAIVTVALFSGLLGLERSRSAPSATRAPALNGTPQTSPAPRRAGTASLRPAPARSVAGRAAGLGNRAPQEG